ncbi:hypothetical protein EI94DRAFT_1702857 [Lactarius quietus]|nr:hypothetical protein EI94DRAFT_1702857 [Lactarius quietus]
MHDDHRDDHHFSNDDDDYPMDEPQSIIAADEDYPFEDETNFADFADDDDSQFIDDSQSYYPTTSMIFFLPMKLSSSSQTPSPFEPPHLSPDIIAQLTPAELAHNPEYMKLYQKVELLQDTVSVFETELIDRREAQAIERVLRWRSEVHA